MDPSEPLLTTEDVANFLRVDVVTVRRLVSRNEIGAYRIGSEYRFSMGDVHAYLERQHIPARTGSAAAFAATIAGAEQEQGFLNMLMSQLRFTQLRGGGIRIAQIQGFTGKRKPKAGLLDKLTKRARSTLNASVQEAQGLDKPYVGTEHLLLGLLRVKEGAAAQALGGLEVSYERAREMAAAITASETVEQPAPADEVPMTVSTQRMIEGAFDEAKQRGDAYVGTEHLLLGLLRQETCVGYGVLQALDVDVERLRQALAKSIRE